MKNYYHLQTIFYIAFLSCFILLINLNSYAQEKGYVYQSRGIPANPDAQTEFIQPDGSGVMIQMHGDAVVNWATTIDGYVLLINENNGFEYAVQDKNKDLILSGIPAQNPDYRSENTLKLLENIKPGLVFSKSQIKTKKENHIFFSQNLKSAKSFPTIGTNNYLLILANFNNTSTT